MRRPTRSPSPPSPPGPKRMTLALMILLQAALFAALSRTLVLPGAVAIAAVLGALPRERAVISRARFLVIMGVLGAACLALWRTLPHYRPGADMDATIGSLGHALGQWALAGQAICLFLDWGTDRRGTPKMPAAAPVAGVVVLLSAGDIRASEAERTAFLIVATLFALLCGVYFSVGNPAGGLWPRDAAGGRRGLWQRRAALLAVVVSVAGLTWGASVTLRRYERTMDRVVRQFLKPEPLSVAAGYGGEARLGDVRARQEYASRSVAMRCYSQRAPGYLRGQAYYLLASTAEGTRWIGGDEAKVQRAERGAPAPLARRGTLLGSPNDGYLFDFTEDRLEGQLPVREEAAPGPPEGLGSNAVEIWPVQSFRGTVFLPPNTVRVVAPEPLLDADRYGVRLTTSTPQLHYAAERRPRRTRPESPEDWTRIAVAVDPADPLLLSLPPLLSVDREVRAVADQVFARSGTPAGHIAAVEEYFHTHYRYQFGAAIGQSRNPVKDFLVRRPAAHCEYFATAATVLLRMRGVPARYATGFVASESNPVGGYWIARNEHAHAWCEAWDPARGWVVVEATPSSGVPDGDDGPNLFGQLWDAAAAGLVRWRQHYFERGWRWLLGVVFAQLTTGPGLVFLLLAGGLIGWRGRRAIAVRLADDPARRAVRRSLRRADRLLARRGLTRTPAEPLHDFAARLGTELNEPTWSAWYASLADLLYRPGLTREAAERARLASPLPSWSIWNSPHRRRQQAARSR